MVFGNIYQISKCWMLVLREARFAGSWYSDDEKKLSKDIEQAENSEFGVGDSQNIPRGKLLGVISPHAGLMYSGATATHAHKLLHSVYPTTSTLIIIGPDHRGVGKGISFYPSGSWESPLGTSAIDDEFLQDARKHDWEYEYIEFSHRSHLLEHSLEMQLPFVHYYYDNKPRMVPIMITHQNTYTANHLANFFTNRINNIEEITPMVVSSDCSHEQDYRRVENNDALFVTAIESGSSQTVNEVRTKHKITSCGYGGILTILSTARKMARKFGKSVEVTTLAYTHSGKVTGELSGYTVGYLSAAVFLV